jgi:hypothetical protein
MKWVTDNAQSRKFVTIEIFRTALAQVIFLTKIVSSTEISRVVVNKWMVGSPSRNLGYI